MAAQLLTLPVAPVRQPAPRIVATVDLSRPDSAERLQEVTGDWLFHECGIEGQRKLLREHELLAA
jgi:hypothetical protein